MPIDKWGYPTPKKDEDDSKDDESDQTSDSTNGKAEDETKWYWGVIGCIAILIGVVIVLVILWFVGNFVWDCIVNIFDGDAGGSSRLAQYCAGKFSRGSYLYQECIDDGWKPWYSTASWLD